MLDPGAAAGARSLEEPAGSIGQLEATLRSLPVPETDRMTQRYQQARTDDTLRVCQPLVSLAEMPRQTLEGKDHNWTLSRRNREGIELVMTGVQEWQGLW